MVSVQTVNGPVDSNSLGMTLFHEHVFSDNRARATPPSGDDRYLNRVWESPMAPRFLAHLRSNPMSNLDNCVLDDPVLAIGELETFVEAGGNTVIDQTPKGMGSNPDQLRRVAGSTGLNIVRGTGFYIEQFHPQRIERMSISDISEEILADVIEGEQGCRAGLIGEIGVSASYTRQESRVLKGAGRARQASRVPISVHLPGWHRLGHEVLDSLNEEGVPEQAVVLSHMNPSIRDLRYQVSLLDRGANLSFDMVGIDWYFSATGFRSPPDHEVAEAIVKLHRMGYGEQIVVSCDTFLKMQLHRYGGPGYDHIPQRFIPSLVRAGLKQTEAFDLIRLNPRAIFEKAHNA